MALIKQIRAISKLLNIKGLDLEFLKVILPKVHFYLRCFTNSINCNIIEVLLLIDRKTKLAHKV